MNMNITGKCEIPVTKCSFEKNFNLFAYCIAKNLQEESNEKFKIFNLKQLNKEIQKIDSSLSNETKLEMLINHWMDSNLFFEAIGGYHFV